MSDQATKPGEAAEAAPEAPADAAPAPSPPQPGKGARTGLGIVLMLIIVSLLWYFAADRLTPSTSQARVQAFVVPVAAEVAGTVLAVHVKNDDEVQRGQPLFDIDPSQYRIALERSRSDYESVRNSVGASAAAVEAARAKLQAARANHIKADKDATRQESLYAEDPGAISVRRLEIAQATRVEARSQEKAAEAELRKAQEAAGDTGDANAQLRSARSAIEKAKLDLARTRVVAPARGRVTDLRTDVGQFAQAGAPLMTLIAIHDLWISADMTENNLGNIAPGNQAAIVLDVLPGQVLKGRVRSVGGGVSSGKEVPPGTLPTVQNSRDWLRQAQRFPVAIEFDPAEEKRLRKVLIGGQAEVMVFTGNNSLMNLLGAGYMRLMSRLTYLY
jgi:multidrug resistance efflux pump